VGAATIAATTADAKEPERAKAAIDSESGQQHEPVMAGLVRAISAEARALGIGVTGTSPVTTSLPVQLLVQIAPGRVHRHVDSTEARATKQALPCGFTCG
jgi:hypothetical protein